MRKIVTFMLLLVCHTQIQAIEVEEVRFLSHGDSLAGSIFFPGNDIDLVSAVVFVHGSGKQRRNNQLGKRFAKHGIAALVYDKRGAGSSGGEYESNQSVSGQNISLLADDAAEAVKFLQQHSKLNGVPIGLTGISQAGWIVPLAAERSDKLDYIALWSSPVCKVSEEDIFSKYTADADTNSVPSYTEALNARKRPYIWPDFLGEDTDPSDNLRRLTMPGLWVFGGNDGSIPVDLSIERLEQRIDAGQPYSYVLFSDEGHNNIGNTFTTVTNWIRRISVPRLSTQG